MKTKFLIVTLSLVFMMFAGIASADEHETYAQAALKSTVARNIVYPEFAKKMGLEGIVYVRIEVSEEGKVTVAQVNGSSQELMNYVVEKFTSNSVDLIPSCYGNSYNMKFTFKLI